MNTMKLLMKLNIGTRLAASFATLLLLMLAIAVIGMNGADKIHGGLKTVYEDRTVPLGQLGEINTLMLRNRILVMDMMIAPEVANVEMRNTELNANIEKANQVWRAYAATHLTPDEKLLAADFIVAFTGYVKDGILATRDAVVTGKADETKRLYKAAISELAPKPQDLLDKLVRLQIDEASREFKAGESLKRSVFALTVVFAAVALLLSSVLAWAISRSITRPIHQALRVAQTVAGGDLTSEIDVRSTDETGRLLQALKDMNDSLVGIVSNVRQSSDSIATGSNQIATGNADLSQRTEEQASNLQQTAASMEQLTATVKQNSDTARQANQLARSLSGRLLWASGPAE